MATIEKNFTDFGEVPIMDFHSLLSMFIFPISLVLLPLLFLLKNKFQVKDDSNKQLPPGPPRLPIIGNLHQIGVLPHFSLWQLSKKYGPVMLFRLGGVPTVIISSAEAAKEVMKTHDLKTCSRPLLTSTGRFSYNYRDIAFTPYGDYWREMRKICVHELFSASKVQSFRYIREEEVALLIDSINVFSSSSTPVDLSEKILSLSADITCREASGKSFRERGINGTRSFQDIIHEAFDLLGSFLAADLFPYVGWIVDTLTGSNARLDRSFHELDSFVEQVIDDHIHAKKAKQVQERENIVDVLLNFTRNQTESRAFQITQDHVKAMLMDIFLAAVDTPAITMVWAMAELARKPSLMRKAQEEIRTFIGDRGRVTEDDLNNFEYLKMIVKETLRLHPAGTLLVPRETMSEININGYHIPSKILIQVNAWAIARDPRVWENPLEFIPERFKNNPIDFKGQDFELIPFGAGRRICPGMNLGIVRVELTLANLLYWFDWKLPVGMKEGDIDMEEAFSLATYKKVPLLLIPVRYRPASAK